MKNGKIPEPKIKIDYKEITRTQLGFDVDQCPCCKTGRMITILNFAANAPPFRLNKQGTKTKK